MYYPGGPRLKLDVFGSLCNKNSVKCYSKDNKTFYSFITKDHIIFHSMRYDWFIISCFKGNKLRKVNKIRKDIPHYIFDDLNNIGLAFWIMDSGYINEIDNCLYIYTSNYTKLEVNLLIIMLTDRFDLVVTKIQKENGYNIKFSSDIDNMNKLCLLVEPFFHIGPLGLLYYIKLKEVLNNDIQI